MRGGLSERTGVMLGGGGGSNVAMDQPSHPGESRNNCSLLLLWNWDKLQLDRPLSISTDFIFLSEKRDGFYKQTGHYNFLSSRVSCPVSPIGVTFFCE